MSSWRGIFQSATLPLQGNTRLKRAQYLAGFSCDHIILLTFTLSLWSLQTLINLFGAIGCLVLTCNPLSQIKDMLLAVNHCSNTVDIFLDLSGKLWGFLPT